MGRGDLHRPVVARTVRRGLPGSLASIAEGTAPRDFAKTRGAVTTRCAASAGRACLVCGGTANPVGIAASSSAKAVCGESVALHR
jgi:hypothetical protein